MSDTNSTAKEKQLEQRQIDYESRYTEILVTYHDGFVKSFSPSDWAIFEEKVTKIAINIVFVEIDLFPKPQMKNWWKGAAVIALIILIGLVYLFVRWAYSLIF